MAYKEMLERFEKTGLYLWQVVVAAEVNNCIDIEDDSDFEKVCEFVYNWIIVTDINVDELCCLISNLLGDGDLKLSDFGSDWEKCRSIISSMLYGGE